MARVTKKRKSAKTDSGDEWQSANQVKTHHQRKHKVRFADSAQAVTFGELQQPKSILKTKAKSIPTTSATTSPSPESSVRLNEQELEEQDANALRTLARAAQKVAEAEKEELQRDLELIKNQAASLRLSHRLYSKSNDEYKQALADAKKRAKVTNSDLQQAQKTISNLENRLKTMNKQLVGVEKQVVKLRQDLATARKEELGMEELLHIEPMK